MMDGMLQNTYDINDNLEEVKRNRAALNILRLGLYLLVRRLLCIINSYESEEEERI